MVHADASRGEGSIAAVRCKAERGCVVESKLLNPLPQLGLQDVLVSLARLCSGRCHWSERLQASSDVPLQPASRVSSISSSHPAALRKSAAGQHKAQCNCPQESSLSKTLQQSGASSSPAEHACSVLLQAAHLQVVHEGGRPASIQRCHGLGRAASPCCSLPGGRLRH